MTREDIIKMAREAGAMFDHMTWVERDLAPVFERFAALVAATEREKVAALMMQRGYATGHGDTIEDLLHELEWQIREQEREACAKVADDRLIAAAPDLLEVLKAFSDYVRDEQMATDGAVTYSTTTINHWAFLARAAIAKATGGEQ